MKFVSSVSSNKKNQIIKAKKFKIMKTKIISLVIGGVVYLLITNSSFSQVNANFKDPDNKYAVSANSKTNLIAPDNAPANVSIAVNDKISKSFSKYFGDAVDQFWSMVSKDFLSSFYA